MILTYEAVLSQDGPLQKSGRHTQKPTNKVVLPLEKRTDGPLQAVLKLQDRFEEKNHMQLFHPAETEFSAWGWDLPTLRVLSGREKAVPDGRTASVFEPYKE